MRLAFRCDASVAIGTGHVVRCLSLAQALVAGGHAVLFVMRDLPGNMCDRVAGMGFAVTRLAEPAPGFVPPPGGPAHAAWAGVCAAQDAAETAQALRGQDWDWLIVDHYAFDAEWQSAIGPVAARLAVIDDLADRRHCCDLLLDQNLGRARADYNALLQPGCRRLIGPQFALLRPGFADLRAQVQAGRPQRTVSDVILAMGGIDAPDATGAVLAALPGGLRVTVVMGSAAPHLAAVRVRAAARGARVLVDTPDMAALMAQADLAIGAVGGSAWERCVLGLPTLMVVLADNQAAVAQALDGSGAARLIGRAGDAGLAAALRVALHDLAQPGALAAMSARAAALCDGRGVPRVVRALEAPALTLRPATLADARAVWDWRQATDPALYRSGANPGWDDHLRWFTRALTDPARRLYIACAAHPVGHLRLEDVPGGAAVSLLINPDCRGQGSGAQLLALAEAEARRLHLPALLAEVSVANPASRAVFAQAGYVAGEAGAQAGAGRAGTAQAAHAAQAGFVALRLAL